MCIRDRNGISGVLKAVSYEELKKAAETAAENIKSAAEPEFKLSGEISGYVYISLEDFGIRDSGEETLDFPNQLGVIIPRTKVPFSEGENMAQATLRLLDAFGIGYSYTGSAESGFYLSCIKDFYMPDGTYISSFGEFSSGALSGWMVSLNRWYINAGASEFTVQDSDLINFTNTCSLGTDLGCDWASPSVDITGLKVIFKNSEIPLSPEFGGNNKNYEINIEMCIRDRFSRGYNPLTEQRLASASSCHVE